MDQTIKFGDTEFERLYEIWMKGKKDAGWIVDGGVQYRVIGSMDGSMGAKEQTVFVKVSSIDDLYGSLTGGLIG